MPVQIPVRIPQFPLFVWVTGNKRKEQYSCPTSNGKYNILRASGIFTPHHWVKTRETWDISVYFQCLAEMRNSCPFSFLIQMDSWPIWCKGRGIIFWVNCVLYRVFFLHIMNFYLGEIYFLLELQETQSPVLSSQFILQNRYFKQTKWSMLSRTGALLAKVLLSCFFFIGSPIAGVPLFRTQVWAGQALVLCCPATTGGQPKPSPVTPKTAA